MLRKILLWLSLFLALTGSAHAGDWLRGEQMGDVIMHGQVTGADGVRYDVWIIPGYVGPLREAAKGWTEAGRALGDYADAKLYADIYDVGKEMVSFGRKTMISEFALKGTSEAWSSAFAAAGERTERRVFGWWFAYPWALIEATGESALRLAIGIPGGITAGALGVTAVPVAGMFWPLGKSFYHLTVQGIALPIVAMSWNTVIAPPMALARNQPTEARADGFWMKRLGPSELALQDDDYQRLQDELKAWRKELVNAPEVRAVELEKQRLAKDYEQQHQALRAEQTRQQKALDEQRITVILQQAQQGNAFPEADKAQLASVLKKYGKQQVVGVLVGDGIGPQQAEALLATLVAADRIEADKAGANDPPRDKTDPLKRSLELIAK